MIYQLIVILNISLIIVIVIMIKQRDMMIFLLCMYIPIFINQQLIKKNKGLKMN